MKRIILLALLVVAGTIIMWSQVPQAMNYKAIAKDDWGVALPNKAITLRFTIVEGSATGTEVYREVHYTITNQFGLMDVEIGNGISDIGIFSFIDWSTGIYYLKIEMDPKGGSDFRLEDPAHQLLSVPFAFYAGNAGGVATELDPVFTASPASWILSGEISNWNAAFNWGDHSIAGYLKSFTETDPVFTAHPAFIIAAENISNWNTAFNWGNHDEAGYLKTEIDGSITNEIQDLSLVDDKLSITNNPSANEIDLSSYKADGSETKVQPGTNVTVFGEGTLSAPYVINATSGGIENSHSVGEFYGGGVIFFVWDNGRHGLISAIKDQDGWGYGIPQPKWRWYAGTYFRTDAVGVLPFSGEMNTAIIIASTAASTNDGERYAARVAREYYIPFIPSTEENVFGDWYLPSRDELLLMCINSHIIDNTATANGGDPFTLAAFYWSSSEIDAGNAWTLVPAQDNDTQYTTNKSELCCIRAIRSF